MSDLYSNWLQCTECGKPCETYRHGWAGTGPRVSSMCCTAPVVVKSTPYIVGTPIKEPPAQ